MEIWVFILTVWAIVRWVQMRLWRQREDERFERVIDTLNRGQARIESLEKQLRELQLRVGPAEGFRFCTPAIRKPLIASYSQHVPC